MSSHIWTPDELRSEARPLEGPAWRLVEAQHRISTLKLVNSLDEQDVLESILDETEPPMPPECRHLDYLLSTPFRYRPYPHGSRSRRAGITPGVWYGSSMPETAIAEMAFYRFLFYAESPETPFPDDAAEYTAFSADLSAAAALDLTAGGLADDTARWMHLTDYGACQALADAAREMAAEVIRYGSVRNPEHGANVAVLTCLAFRNPAPVRRQS